MIPLRKLFLFEDNRFIRTLLAPGAFTALEDGDTFYVTAERGEEETLRSRPGHHLGAVEQPLERKREYHRLRRVLLFSFRHRSPAQRLTVALTPRAKRWRFKALALPGVRQLVLRRALGRLGLHSELHRLIEEVRPDVVISPTGGVDTLTFDAARSARALGIPTVAVIYGWDNLSLKAAFPVKSDYYAVIGEQSSEIATRVHRIPRDRVVLAGSPYIDYHFHRPLGVAPSPFPFRYALFAGASLKFDERSVLERLDAEIETRGLAIKIVYRPHPLRLPRDVPDAVGESDFRHVVIDPQVRDRYLATWASGSNAGAAALVPDYQATVPDAGALGPDYYQALVENAEFVLSPLSTMMIEAGIYDRQVVVLAYNDGVHLDSADMIFNYEFCDGLARIEGFHVCREADEVPPLFVDLASGDIAQSRSIRDQMSYFVHSDQRTYSERLAKLVNEIAGVGPVSPSSTQRPARMTALIDSDG